MMAEYHSEQHNYYEEALKNKDIRSMPEGSARLAALRDLGVTFDEGQHRTTKIATPSGTPKLPTFVDAAQIEVNLLSCIISALINHCILSSVC